jgi:hypothetical protein
MSSFLTDFLVTMPETQKKKLLEILDAKRQMGLLQSEEQFQRELEAFLKELEQYQGTPTFRPIYQDERTNSQRYNQAMEAIAFDLATLFEASNQIDALMTNHQQLSRSMLADIRKKIYSLQDQVQKYQFLLNHSDVFVQAINEDFRVPQYTETDETVLSLLRKDRFGRPFSAHMQAENHGYALQLASITTEDQLKTSYGRALAKIQVRNRTGLVASNQQYPVENAIDGSPDTFWAEAVIVDDVIQQDISDLWSHDYHDYPKTGAICELELLFQGMTTVSEIQFVPYCSYPLEIVAIHGYEREDSSGAMYTLVSPNHSNVYQRSQKSTDRMVFQFPSVTISKLRILIRQENYEKENFIVSYDDLHQAELWDQIASTSLVPDLKEPGESIEEFNRKNEITGWSLYLKKLKEWATIMRKEGLVEAAEKAMELIRVGDYKNPLLLALRSMNNKGEKSIVNDQRSPLLSQQWLAVNKLAYIYGAYDIRVYGRQYHQTSIYVSRSFPLNSNVRTISLSTGEQHHYIPIGPAEQSSDQGITNDQAKITDIEYYVTFKKNPSVEDWIPILPVEQRYVEGELLYGDQVQGDYPEFKNMDLVFFSFRFPIVSKETVTIRQNGYPMRSDAYVISDDGKKVGIKRAYYSPSSIYTADYKPVDDAYLVDVYRSIRGIEPVPFTSPQGELGERFASVGLNQSIELSYYPYLFRDQMYQYNQHSQRYEYQTPSQEIYYPIIVRVNGQEFKNITDYTTNTYDPERLKENGGKTFAHVGKTIVFGSPIDGTDLRNIVVDYHYLPIHMRLKAILRRNHASHNSVTPSLYRYQIRCQSFDQEE